MSVYKTRSSLQPGTTFGARPSIPGSGAGPSAKEPPKDLAVPFWFIELERGWGPWAPGIPLDDDPAEGTSIHYTIGRSEFEAHFENEREGTQTNLVTGKVRCIRRILPSEKMPEWESCGTRRRPPPTSKNASGTCGVAPPPANTAAAQAQAARNQRRSVVGGYPAPASRTQQQPEVCVKPTPGYARPLRTSSLKHADVRSTESPSRRRAGSSSSPQVER